MVSLNVNCSFWPKIGLAVLLRSTIWLSATSVTLLSASLGEVPTEEAASRVAEAEKGSIEVLGNAHSLFNLQSGVVPRIDYVSKELVLNVRHYSSDPICIDSSFSES